MSMNAHQALQDALAAAPAEANPVAGSQTHTHRRNRHAEIARYQHGRVVPDVDFGLWMSGASDASFSPPPIVRSITVGIEKGEPAVVRPLPTPPVRRGEHTLP